MPVWILWLAALCALPAVWWLGRRVLIRVDAWLLRLEEDGWIYYRRKQSSVGGLGALVELQKVMEPGVKQVLEVESHSIRKQSPGNDDTNGDSPAPFRCQSPN
ncbi:MAG: hypothetical protein NT069_04270 [Planctomycetota bacterium]|nr:hypothetical protein [Planctomycetota bacterium]